MFMRTGVDGCAAKAQQILIANLCWKQEKLADKRLADNRKRSKAKKCDVT